MRKISLRIDQKQPLTLDLQLITNGKLQDGIQLPILLQWLFF